MEWDDGECRLGLRTGFVGNGFLFLFFARCRMRLVHAAWCGSFGPRGRGECGMRNFLPRCWIRAGAGGGAFFVGVFGLLGYGRPAPGRKTTIFLDPKMKHRLLLFGNPFQNKNLFCGASIWSTHPRPTPGPQCIHSTHPASFTYRWRSTASSKRFRATLTSRPVASRPRSSLYPREQTSRWRNLHFKLKHYLN